MLWCHSDNFSSIFGWHLSLFTKTGIQGLKAHLSSLKFNLLSHYKMVFLTYITPQGTQGTLDTDGII